MTVEQEKAISVGQFIEQVNSLFTEIGPVLIEAEISSIQNHPSGIYITLKDPKEEAILSGYMHPRAYEQSGIILEEGMLIRAHGTPNIYKQKGRFSLVIRSIELAGEGVLQKNYEALKKKLEGEGLFARKRRLSALSKRIAIITSKSGAVINDFKNNIVEADLSLTLYDVRVEGVRAVEDILNAMIFFNQHAKDYDLLVIMRGGGSLEDLQAFNHEQICRAIFGSILPTVVAIGHDRDIPIAQMVADVAPSTPTAAAVAINQSWLEARNYLKNRVNFFQNIASEIILNYENRIHLLQSAIARELRRTFENIRQSLSQYERYILSVHPQRIFEKGYSITSNAQGKVIRSIKNIEPQQIILNRFADGTISAKVEGIHSNDQTKTPIKRIAR